MPSEPSIAWKRNDAAAKSKQDPTKRTNRIAAFGFPATSSVTSNFSIISNPSDRLRVDCVRDLSFFSLVFSDRCAADRLPPTFDRLQTTPASLCRHSVDIQTFDTALLSEINTTCQSTLKRFCCACFSGWRVFPCCQRARRFLAFLPGMKMATHQIYYTESRRLSQPRDTLCED